MTVDLIFIALGLAGLVAGGDLLVRGGLALAGVLKLSPVAIGIVVLGFGTSMPELATSLTAALRDQGEIAIGNVAGSNIANILLILGLTALLFPVACDTRVIRRDGAALMFFSAILVAGILWTGFPRLLAFIMLAVFAVYLFIVVRGGDVETPDATEVSHEHQWGRGVLFSVSGVILLIISARFLVDGAVGIATDLGVSEALIGLTVVAIGTSLPELAASVSAALKKQGGMAFGNVIGSNIFNAGAILGTTAVVSPLSVPLNIGRIDTAALMAAAVFALWFGVTGRRIVRWEGAVLLAGYGAYLVLTSQNALS